MYTHLHPSVNKFKSQTKSAMAGKTKSVSAAGKTKSAMAAGKIKSASAAGKIKHGTRLAVGDLVARADAGDVCGKVMFRGKTQFAPGVWIGIAWDTPDGSHDGVVKGVRYFECEAGHGSMLRPALLTRLPPPPSPPPATFVTEVPAAASSSAPRRPVSYYSWTTSQITEYLAEKGTDAGAIAATEVAGVTGREVYTLLEGTPDYELGEALAEQVGLDPGAAARSWLAAMRALPPPPGEELIAAHHFGPDARVCLLSNVREAMKAVVAETRKFPLLLDPSGTVQVFLKYAVNAQVSGKALVLAKATGREWKPELVRGLTSALNSSVLREPLLWFDLGNAAVEVDGLTIDGVFPRPALVPRALASSPHALLDAFMASWAATVDDDYRETFQASPDFAVVATSALDDATAASALPASGIFDYFEQLRVVVDNPLPGSQRPAPTAACVGCRAPDDYLLAAYCG
ncbi:uncharacterized protein AMSG_07538 [Thecamonas trahens ATCC 50062]|uniref:CAP-Gly domain-containing protein n=1 Tax=Thecamonas trahens ATCC 50062 TaxID=461836 RepID=A0A0L0DHF1_THETB|nr:hypothetical protein AMSG_07538 [Thecamonas trahens ATCC 50062]KNC51625.1 hypothetical protein AMSG_07538 [Thecamonas trahens ATCC 50062]|eukprot:XP_013756020.1 hypothetical protein AMSG_07538 [Thecamonas trahens ATCC 50062]